MSSNHEAVLSRACKFFDALTYFSALAGVLLAILTRSNPLIALVVLGSFLLNAFFFYVAANVLSYFIDLAATLDRHDEALARIEKRVEHTRQMVKQQAQGEQP